MLNDSRPVDLLSDSAGVYGIGIVYDDVLNKRIAQHPALPIDDAGKEPACATPGRHKPLTFCPDVLREFAFPNKYREAALQTLGNKRVIVSSNDYSRFSRGLPRGQLAGWYCIRGYNQVMRSVTADTLHRSGSDLTAGACGRTQRLSGALWPLGARLGSDSTLHTSDPESSGCRHLFR